MTTDETDYTIHVWMKILDKLYDCKKKGRKPRMTTFG
jgi:hypothetical protein